ncbi:amidohydrolase [Pseudomonas neustonica]|uniref:Amidohydrolase n=1 Tax=Pseudomonas neustonica TaxID=2487346 RepID=A0ABX9XIH9_9PSED|nr:N-acyl-L-amino acid amidohydrolase [Pseudomonadales bacterium]ROZ83257.1 amidohydrolase [Pseudomonas sp. SSM44]ROZ85214.1 amidohydrolase [Pseudomonas neustonica]
MYRLRSRLALFISLSLLPAFSASAEALSLNDRALAAAEQLSDKAIAWRHDIHQHPELGNQETRTAALVAAHLSSLGMEVETNVGTTGVVAWLKGGKPGPVVALRADMDALPVKEATALPYASNTRQMYLGNEQDVMHACGHDAHVAILMATAEALAGMRESLPGSVKFIFQPAEEGPSDYVYDGERYFGARQLVAEGVLHDPAVDVIFGLHVTAALPTGMIAYRSGPTMASSGDLHIRVRGKQTHGAQPWDGVDPVLASAQIVTALQGVVSRQTDIMQAPAVVSIGTINGGTRHNIIPDEVTMSGTVRTFNDAVQAQVNERIKNTAEHVAAASGATAEVNIVQNYATTVNDPELTAQMLPTLRRAAWNIAETPLVTGSEDFSYYAKEVPGMFFFLGVTPTDNLGKAAPNHSPGFLVDDQALVTGIKAMTTLTTDYLEHVAQSQ